MKQGILGKRIAFAGLICLFLLMMYLMHSYLKLYREESIERNEIAKLKKTLMNADGEYDDNQNGYMDKALLEQAGSEIYMDKVSGYQIEPNTCSDGCLDSKETTNIDTNLNTPDNLDHDSDYSEHYYELQDTSSKSKQKLENKRNQYEDCVIEIPDINLSKIVYTGKDREKRLEQYELITASADMKYSNGGNYIICGHASRLYGHSLNRIKEVHKGALIQIWANKKVDEYVVDEVSYEDMNQTSKYCEQTDKQQLTIISCARYISDHSYIVIKAVRKK